MPSTSASASACFMPPLGQALHRSPRGSTPILARAAVMKSPEDARCRCRWAIFSGCGRRPRQAPSRLSACDLLEPARRDPPALPAPSHPRVAFAVLVANELVANLVRQSAHRASRNRHVLDWRRGQGSTGSRRRRSSANTAGSPNVVILKARPRTCSRYSRLRNQKHVTHRPCLPRSRMKISSSDGSTSSKR